MCVCVCHPREELSRMEADAQDSRVLFITLTCPRHYTHMSPSGMV